MLIDIENEVRKTLREALVKASELTGTPVLETRIKICSPDGDGKLHFHILKGTKQITVYDEDKEDCVFVDANGKKKVVNIRTLLDISVDLFGKAKIYNSLLRNVVMNVAFKNEVPLKDADFRIYSHDERIASKDWLVVMEKEMKEYYESQSQEEQTLIDEGKKFIPEWVKTAIMLPNKPEKFSELSLAQLIEAGDTEAVMTEVATGG